MVVLTMSVKEATTDIEAGMPLKLPYQDASELVSIATLRLRHVPHSYIRKISNGIPTERGRGPRGKRKEKLNSRATNRRAGVANVFFFPSLDRRDRQLLKRGVDAIL